uniref:Indole-3-acetic acid-amido synthetase GH3.1 n=1 Tax=Nelumbo nucifera TaxID=4432 RepID=A0A822ZEG8_NELNU|nr:TPA_asm: hypothetical protein HUJ06_015729 [Nelumbo nucifera]
MAVDSSISSSSEKHATALQFIEDMTKNADSVQQKVLAEILTQNAETEYLRRYQLGGSTDRDTFKSKIPVITYEDLQPEIQRIANGDRSAILSAHPISEFLTSSGTSAGERKLMPTIQAELDRRQLLYSLLTPLCTGTRQGEGSLLLLRQIRDKDARWTVGPPSSHQLLQE